MSLKHILLSSVLLLFIHAVATGKTLQTLLKDQAELDLVETVNPVVLGETLIYQIMENGQPTLQALNTRSHEKSSLYIGELQPFGTVGYASLLDQYLHATDELVFFTTQEHDNKFIWRTDGSAAGTYQVQSPPLKLVTNPVGNFMVALTAGYNNLVVSNGHTTVVHETINNANLNNTCVFTVNDVVTSARSTGDSQGHRILRSDGSQFTDLSAQIGHNLVNNMWQQDDTCYMLFGNQSDEPEVALAFADGTTKRLSQAADLTGLIQVFEYKDRVFALFKGSNDQSFIIKRFNPNLNSFPNISGFDAQFLGASPTLNNQVMTTALSEQYIIVASSYGRIYDNYEMYYLDVNLRLNQGLSGGFERILYRNAGSPTKVPQIHNTLNGELYVTSAIQPPAQAIREAGASSETLSFNIDPSEPAALVIQDDQLLHMITNKSHDGVYMMLKNKLSGQTGIYALSDAPDIDKSIKGIWHDPNIKNQGIAITTGTRVDGSEYLFVTVYTFKDGQPLWLAGVGEVQPPQTTIDVLLASYNGLDTFEAGFTPNQEIYGNLNLTMTACDRLTARLEPANDAAIELDLTRINNTEFNGDCHD